MTDRNVNISQSQDAGDLAVACHQQGLKSTGDHLLQRRIERCFFINDFTVAKRPNQFMDTNAASLADKVVERIRPQYCPFFLGIQEGPCRTDARSGLCLRARPFLPLVLRQ